MSLKLQVLHNEYSNLFELGKIMLNNVFGIRRTETFEWKDFTNQQTSTIFKQDNINIFLSTISEILKKNGFIIDDNHYHLDFHRYNLFGEKYSSNIVWHQDDYGGTTYPVHTVILYLRKDITIQGGNLLVKNQKKIITTENTIVLMDGRIVHKPEELEGTGCRDSIVVQFKRV